MKQQNSSVNLFTHPHGGADSGYAGGRHRHCGGGFYLQCLHINVLRSALVCRDLAGVPLAV